MSSDANAQYGGARTRIGLGHEEQNDAFLRRERGDVDVLVLLVLEGI